MPTQMSCFPRLWSPVTACLMASLIASALAAQCQLDWQPGVALSGPSGRVIAAANLPNGDLVVGGWFLEAGATTANRLARWDGAAWHAFGAGLDDNVYDIVVATNGDLIVGGKFEHAGGAPANRVARWDGSAWSPLGVGLNGIVNCLELLPNGNLIAAGVFSASGATSTQLVAEWNGTSWSQLGGGLVGGEITSMTRMANGDLVVAGALTSAGGNAVNGAALWDGTSWSGLPFQPIFVSSVAAAPNGDLALSGLLDVAPVTTIAIWDGVSLNSVAGPGSPGKLFYDTNGDLLSIQSNLGTGIVPIMRWDGTTWSQLGGLPDIVPITLHRTSTGELLAGGGNNLSLTPFAQTLSTFDGTGWNAWGSLPANMAAFATSENGDLYGGSYSGGFSASAVSRWNGTQWVSVGPAIVGAAADLVALQNGGLFAVGHFETGPNPAEVMLWDGVTWTAINADLGSFPIAAAEGPDGTLYLSGHGLAGQSSVVQFDGAGWVPVGGGLPGVVFDMTFLSNGDLLVAQTLGFGALATGQCMRWDGTSWTPYGPALHGRIRSVLTEVDGTVRVAGEQLLPTSGSHVLAGDGTTWSVLGGGFDGYVSGLQFMPNGDLLANGRFTMAGSATVGGLARWDGASWSGVGADATGAIERVGLTRDGDVFVAGAFTRLAGAPSAAFGRAITNCPALVQSYGSGCIGPNGPLVLASLSSPWSGSEYRTRVYGTPSSSFVVNAIGATSVSVSLPSLLPQSFSGCSLLVSGDVLDLVLPSNGVAEPRIQIPGTPALVGAAFYQQVLAFQVDQSFNLLSVSSSNGLAATIGFF